MANTDLRPAQKAFLDRKAAIDDLLVRLADHSDDHFGANPDRLHWGDVGSLGAALARLREAAELLGLEGGR